MQVVFQFIRLAQQHLLCGRRRLAAQRFCVCLEFLLQGYSCCPARPPRREMVTSVIWSVRRCVSASKYEMVSISSPQNSTRTGAFPPGSRSPQCRRRGAQPTCAVNLIGAHIATAHQRPHNLIHRNFLSGREFHRALSAFWRQNILAMPRRSSSQCRCTAPVCSSVKADALALIFMRAAPSVAQAEIAQGVKRRSHAHRVSGLPAYASLPLRRPQ